MQKITPFLCFDGKAGEAMKFYTSIFKDSKILASQTVHTPTGDIVWGTFSIQDQEFFVLDGGPTFKFTEAISLYINCHDQEEVDYLWEKLSSEGGQKVQCGWLKDKYGVAWQVIPEQLTKLMHDPDPVKANRVAQAMMKMTKIIIADLEKAYAGE
jgi:predicted 3-demethylubiquinone-9 3-methyltransferase (glyoxalase superfamily)